MEKKTLEYFKANAEELYNTTPIGVLRYISELESRISTPQVEVSEEKKTAKEYYERNIIKGEPDFETAAPYLEWLEKEWEKSRFSSKKIDDLLLEVWRSGMMVDEPGQYSFDQFKETKKYSDIVSEFRSLLSQSKQEKWISVEDEKPKYGEVVLLWHSAQLVKITGFWDGYMFRYVQAHIVCYDNANDNNHNIQIADVMPKFITHWQPLPPAPTKGGKDE